MTLNKLVCTFELLFGHLKKKSGSHILSSSVNSTNKMLVINVATFQRVMNRLSNSERLIATKQQRIIPTHFFVSSFVAILLSLSGKKIVK